MASTTIKIKKPEGGLSSYTSSDTGGDKEEMTGKPGVKERWKQLSKKDQWDCLVALRGPDITHSELIKYFTTGVIRKEMGNFMRVGGQISDVGFVVVASGTVFAANNGPIKPDLNHFLQHAYEAASILGIPTIHLPAQLWEKMMVKPYYQAAMAYLLNCVKADKTLVTAKIYEELLSPLMTQYAMYMKEKDSK